MGGGYLHRPLLCQFVDLIVISVRDSALIEACAVASVVTASPAAVKMSPFAIARWSAPDPRHAHFCDSQLTAHMREGFKMDTTAVVRRGLTGPSMRMEYYGASPAFDTARTRMLGVCEGTQQAAGRSYEDQKMRRSFQNAEVDRQRRENEDYTRDRSELLGISGVYCVARISAGISARIVWLSQPLPNSCFADFSS
eukprot:COSAG01_NODE_3015_length_6719_cov_129.305996_8_plen_196_part_00